MCARIGFQVMTATGMYHRVSTGFWRMDVTEENIECFTEHVNDHRKIDRSISASPPALTVTPTLEKIDG